MTERQIAKFRPVFRMMVNTLFAEFQTNVALVEQWNHGAGRVQERKAELLEGFIDDIVEAAELEMITWQTP